MKKDQSFLPSQPSHASSSSSKSHGILKQLSTLHDKIYQGQYSPRNIFRFTEHSLDSKTAFKIVLSTCLFMLSFQFKLEDHFRLTILKLIWIISLFSYFYKFPPKSAQNLQKQLAVFFILRLLSSSMVYSLVSGHQLSFEAHTKSQEHDILVNVFLTTMLAVAQQQAWIFRKFIKFQFTGYLILSVILQIWLQRFDYTVFVHQIFWFLSLLVFCEFIGKHSKMDRKIIQATLNQHCEDISQELNNIKHKLEEESESESSLASSLNTSKVDELVMKIKYMKFTLLQKENEKTFLNTRPVFTSQRRRTYVCTYPGPISPYAVEKKFEDPCVTSGSLSDFRRSCSLQTAVPPKNDVEAKWRFFAEDCDNLVKLILEKQVIMWYPEVLKSKEHHVNRETAE